MTAATPEYFTNHDRRRKLPWSLYHADLSRRIARALAELGPQPRVLIVGCGLEPAIEDGPPGAIYSACDLDPRAIELCKARHPEMCDRLAVCPDEKSLPRGGGFDVPFDAVVAKEVIEHVETPNLWARMVAERVGRHGQLVLTTPNYGWTSTLSLLESTVLEWVARRDGYSRKHIHPSRFDRRRLARLDVGAGMRLIEVAATWTRWALIGRWRRFD